MERRVTTVDDFTAWLQTAKKGDACIYHVSDVMTAGEIREHVEACARKDAPIEPDLREQFALLNVVWHNGDCASYTHNQRLVENLGFVVLLQRRVGASRVFEYIAVRNGKER